MQSLSLAVLIALLPLLIQVRAQTMDQPTSWTMNASDPQTNPSTSGCMVLAQLDKSASPKIIQAMKPICPSTTPNPATPALGAQITWPIAIDECDDSQQPSLALYGGIEHKADRTDLYMSQAACVMVLDPTQVRNILGKSFTWNNNLQQFWENTGNDFVLGADGAALKCGADATLLPPSLWLPDPYVADFADPVWASPITLAVPTSKPKGDDTAQPDPAISTATADSASSAVGPAPTSVDSAVPTNTDMAMTEPATTDPTATEPSSTAAAPTLTTQNLVGTDGTTTANPTTVAAVESPSDTGECSAHTVTVTAQPMRRSGVSGGYPPMRGLLMDDVY